MLHAHKQSYRPMCNQNIGIITSVQFKQKTSEIYSSTYIFIFINYIN